MRLATQQDIPQLVQLMLKTKRESAWRDLNVDFNEHTLPEFLHRMLGSADSVCYVWDDPMDAFCGASLGRMHVPPYLPYVFEWGWTGPKKRAVASWQACRAWGWRHGAVLACRTSSKPGSKITESVTWEKL